MTEPEPSLDPDSWAELRALGHRMLDDMFDHLAGLRAGPVWRPMPAEARAALQGGPPRAGEDLGAVYEEFRALVLPYATGNLHPGFMGWVHGGGTAVGMLAELLAGGLNANLGGRDHAPILVERQVIAWTAALLGLPATSTGLLLTGSSMANLVGVLLARTAALGPEVRRHGIGGAKLAGYASTAAHGCIPRAFEIAGLGRDALRLVPTDAEGRIDCAALAGQIARDRASGVQPFLLIGTAGSVDIGATDDLARLAALARAERLWFHVDGAFGALAACAPALRPLLDGIEAADSVALDFHKWAQVPYDAGCILVREPAAALATFAQSLAYLQPAARGLAGGAPWPCDIGPDLSRGFRALKVWLTLRAYGTERIGAVIEHCCAVARALAARVDAEPALERLAPVPLNIVCFRHRVPAGWDADAFNAAIVADVQESGRAAPSTTIRDGRLAIRAAIVNHRTRVANAEALVAAVLEAGAARLAGMSPANDGTVLARESIARDSM